MKPNPRNARLRQVFKELKAKGLVESQLDFANQLTYDKGHISNIMSVNVEKPVTRILADRMQVIFGVSKDWLLKGTGEMYMRGGGEVQAPPNNSLMLVQMLELHNKLDRLAVTLTEIKALLTRKSR